VLDIELVRLQCHEGLDRAQALYAWDHARQLLHLRAMEASGRPDHVDELYDERFLLERPLLRALRRGRGAVLLSTRSTAPTTSSRRSCWSCSPTSRSRSPSSAPSPRPSPPIVVLTSNRTRELSDALKRRCLYHWIDHPDVERETAIVRCGHPRCPRATAQRVARLSRGCGSSACTSRPGVAEAIDWARVLAADPDVLADRERLRDTLGVVVKDHDDLQRARGALDDLLA
jgi:MoxR-like ATPase